MLCLELAKTRSDWWSFKRPVFYAFQVELITIEKQSAGNRRAISSSTKGSQKKKKKRKERKKNPVPSPLRSPVTDWCSASFHASSSSKLRGQIWAEQMTSYVISFFHSAFPKQLCFSGSTVQKAAGSYKGTNTKLRESYSLVVFALERHMKV